MSEEPETVDQPVWECRHCGATRYEVPSPDCPWCGEAISAVPWLPDEAVWSERLDGWVVTGAWVNHVTADHTSGWWEEWLGDKWTALPYNPDGSRIWYEDTVFVVQGPIPGPGLSSGLPTTAADSVAMADEAVRDFLNWQDEGERVAVRNVFGEWLDNFNAADALAAVLELRAVNDQMQDALAAAHQEKKELLATLADDVRIAAGVRQIMAEPMWSEHKVDEIRALLASESPS